MRLFLRIFLVALLLVLPAYGQTNSTPRTDLTNKILSPNPDDLSQAEKEGLQVFKILPRGMFDESKNDLSIRGGGAYYSFTKSSHSYNDIPQIELQQDELGVGFYGASYGLIANLENCSLSMAGETAAKITTLLNYQPRQLESEARAEYQTLHRGLEIDGVIFKRRLPAVVGNSYILRAVSFREADTAVIFKIHRRDADGGLIIFWKLLREFEKPILIRTSAP